MQTENARAASRTNSAPRPSGFRRLTPAMMKADRIADQFKGSPNEKLAVGLNKVLAEFKAAAPYLGYSMRTVFFVDVLFTLTRPQDWLEGSRPIVWPSTVWLIARLGLGRSQVKALIRLSFELGLIAMKDSPNGKRYGYRNDRKQIIEAYGFDLSPLFVRFPEFVKVAEEGRAKLERMRYLRRRRTILWKALQQIIETATELGLIDVAWIQLERECGALAQSLQKLELEQLEEMEFGVSSLERRQQEAQERIRMQITATEPDAAAAVDFGPSGSESRPHIIPTKEHLNPMDTVLAPTEYRSPETDEGSSQHWCVPSIRQQGKARGALSLHTGNDDTGTRPEEIIRLAPRLRSYVTTSVPDWADIIEAAASFRHELGVSQPLWGDACFVMGRKAAAVALAIVSTKPTTHFTGSPGGYFHGMVVKAKAGELHLAPTIWALRKLERGAI